MQIFQKVGPYFYPFDNYTILIAILPFNVSGCVVLIPHFSNFLVDEAFKTGVSDMVHIKRWSIGKTYFTYRLHDFSSSFWLAASPYLTEYPELQFNIKMRRNIIDSIVSYGAAALAAGEIRQCGVQFVDCAADLE